MWGEFVEGQQVPRQVIELRQEQPCRPVFVVHRLVSAFTSAGRVGILRRVGRLNCGTRPVVWSAGSGSATIIPSICRSSAAALTATPASCAAVTAPAETPSTVALVRIVSAMRGAWLSPRHVAVIGDGDS